MQLNKKNKRKIAIEIIIFVSTISLCLSIYGVINWMNYYRENKLAKLQDEYHATFVPLTFNKKFLSEGFRSKLDGYVSQMEADEVNTNEIQHFVNDFKEKYGTTDTAGTSAFNHKENIYSQMAEIRYSIVTQGEINYKALYIALIIGILLYPLRGLFFALKWSVCTLRNKEPQSQTA